jgi:hypothetical protein
MTRRSALAAVIGEYHPPLAGRFAIAELVASSSAGASLDLHSMDGDQHHAPPEHQRSSRNMSPIEDDSVGG